MWKPLAMVALIACGAKKVDHLELEIVVFGKTSVIGAKLELDGRELGMLDHGGVANDGRLIATLPPEERTLDGFVLIVPTPCGDKRIPLVLGVGGRRAITSVELAAVNGGKVYVALDVPDGALSSYGLLYDNRGGKATTLTFGKLALPVRANSKGALPVWEVTCGRPIALAADGRALDIVQEAFADRCGDAQPQVFVGLAARCYVVHAVPYEVEWTPFRNDAAPATETKLEGHDAYVVPAITYVMEKAPTRVQTDDARGHCLRDLVECGTP